MIYLIIDILLCFIYFVSDHLVSCFKELWYAVDNSN